MSFLAILFSLFIEHFLGSLEELRRFDWFARYARRVRESLPRGGRWEGALGVSVVMALPVVAVALVGYALFEFWVLLGFIYAVFVLLYSFGPRDLEAEVEAFADARERRDEESARWHAAGLLGADVPEAIEQQTRAIVERVLTEAHERLLGIVFWFILLGPLGAILYRLSRELDDLYREEESPFAQAAWRLHYLLGWLPARLCAFGYALAGSFVDAMQRWRELSVHWEDDNQGALAASGLGALRYEPREQAMGEPDPQVEVDNVREALGLVRRAVMIWLSVLAILTLAGWHG